MDFEKLMNKQEEMSASGEVEKMYETKASFKSDDRFYTISKDQEGNGTAIIRFLPSPNFEGSSLNYFVKRFTHNVKHTKLYPGAEKPEIRSFWGDDAICPKTKDSKAECPICDHGWALYNDAKENGATKEQTSKILQNWTNNEELITNIMVINDKINPANNGKVFLFKLPKGILEMMKKESEKIKEILDMHQDSEQRLAQGVPSNVTCFDAYNLLQGKNMTLKYKNHKKVSTPSEIWGSSYWDVQFTALVKDSKEWEEIVKSTHVLEEFTTNAEVKDKSFFEDKINWLLFQDSTSTKVATKTVSDEPTKQNVEVKVQEDEQFNFMNQMMKAQEPVANVQEPVYTEPEPVYKEPEIKKEEPKPETKQTTVDEDSFFAQFQS